jgi:amino acid transporter
MILKNAYGKTTLSAAAFVLMALSMIINVSGNKVSGKSSQFLAVAKIAGIIVFAIGGL